MAQDFRMLNITTPLGANVLSLLNVDGEEPMSRLFHYDLEMISGNTAITAATIVGKPVTWWVIRSDQTMVYWNGIVSKWTAGPPLGDKMTRIYRAEVVPWTWFLTLTADCRIYQNMTVPQIIQQVFGLFGLTDFKVSCTGTHPVLEYCVQYRETAFNFISRLMEREGIFYFFQHANGKHTMVIADAVSAYQDCTEKQVTHSLGTLSTSYLTEWNHKYAYRTGKWTETDYNFETPGDNKYDMLVNTQTTTSSLPGITKYEKYDYPGCYMVKGNAMTTVRIQEEEVDLETGVGAGNCATFKVGGKFTIKTHELTSEAGKNYVITGIRQQIWDYSDYPSLIPPVQPDGPASSLLREKKGEMKTVPAQMYANAFNCIPDTVLYRPARITPKPFVKGPQTAVVVGPAGEEIYVDKYGRIKVQFYWDRIGQLNENSSCWIRVSEQWAGKGWGFHFHPRIGQEVIVDFLEGDPDRPIVTGRVYNAVQTVPYALPANMTKSGVHTCSTKNGVPTVNYNEIRFEDLKGSEEIYIHAERDQNRVVENNDTLTVGSANSQYCPVGSQTISIWKDRTEYIETGNETLTIKQGNRVETISVGNDSLTITKGNRTEQIQTGTETLTVKGDRTITVQTGNDSHTISTGNRSVTVTTGTDTLTVKGNRTTTVQTGNDAKTVSTGNHSINVSAGTSAITAAQSITLTCGGSSIKLEPAKITLTIGASTIALEPAQIGLTAAASSVQLQAAQITASSPMVSITGDATAELSGAMVTVSGDGLAKVSAPVVNVSAEGIAMVAGALVMIG